MSNEKMTPGPWKLGELSNEVLTSSGHSVASPPDGEADEQWQIDARAIAAVPDLVKALRALVEMADEKVTTRRTHEIASLARAALEKAGAL